MSDHYIHNLIKNKNYRLDSICFNFFLDESRIMCKLDNFSRFFHENFAENHRSEFPQFEKVIAR